MLIDLQAFILRIVPSCSMVKSTGVTSTIVPEEQIFRQCARINSRPNPDNVSDISRRLMNREREESFFGTPDILPISWAAQHRTIAKECLRAIETLVLFVYQFSDLPDEVLCTLVSPFP